MRILVTGGSGFIASHIVTHLVKKYPNYYIVNLDKLDSCSSVKNNEAVASCPNYRFVRGDITSPDLVRYVLEAEQVDTIIHAAAQSHVDASFGNSLSFTLSNVYGTHVLLEAAKAAGITRFLHMSTDEVYGSCAAERKTENSATNPTNPYSASKAAAESIVGGYINSFNFPAIITRGNNVYGKRQYVEKVIPKFIIRLMRGEKCCIHGAGTNRRHYLHVEDTVEAIDLILHKGVLASTYNIGSNEELTNLQIAEKLVRLIKGNDVDLSAWIEHVPDRAFNDARYYLSFEKLTDLGWKPKHTLESSLPDVVDWYKKTDIETYWGKGSVTALEAHPCKTQTMTLA